MNHQSWVPWVCYQAIAGFGEIRRAATRGKMLAALSRGGQLFFPESVWAKGSSNSGGLFYIFTSSHLLIFTSTHISSSHPHILTSSLSLSLSPFLSLSLSCPLSPSLSFFFFSFLRPPFRGKWGSISSIVKNWGKIAILKCPRQLFRTKWGSNVKNWGKIAIWKCPRQPFRTKWGSNVKNWLKNCDLEVSAATLSHKMRFECQKLMFFCEFGWSC